MYALAPDNIWPNCRVWCSGMPQTRPRSACPSQLSLPTQWTGRFQTWGEQPYSELTFDPDTILSLIWCLGNLSDLEYTWKLPFDDSFSICSFRIISLNIKAILTILITQTWRNTVVGEARHQDPGHLRVLLRERSMHPHQVWAKILLYLLNF